MVEVLKNEVRMPVWILGLILSLLITMFTYTAIWGQSRRQIEINTKAGVFINLAQGNYQVVVRDAESSLAKMIVEIVSPLVDVTYAAVIRGSIEQNSIRGDLSKPLSGEVKILVLH